MKWKLSASYTNFLIEYTEYITINISSLIESFVVNANELLYFLWFDIE